MNTPAQCGAIKPPKTDIYSEAPHVGCWCGDHFLGLVVGVASRRVLSNWCVSRWWGDSGVGVGGVGVCGVLWAVRVGPRGGAAGVYRVNVPCVWVMPRLVRLVRLTAAALVVSQRWLAATPR